MKTSKTRLLLLLVLPALVLFSCVKERLDPNTVDSAINSDETSVLVTLQMPPSPAPTRALTPIDENHVENIDVLAFRKVDVTTIHPSGWAYTYKAQGTAITDDDLHNPNPDKRFKKFTVTLIKNPAEQLFVVLANVRNEVDGLGDIALGADKDKLLERLISSTTVNTPWDANNADAASPYTFRPFPMWGEVKATLTDNTTDIPTSGSVGMLRSIARLDFVLENTVNNFELGSIHVYNSKNKGYIAPDPANMDGTTIKAVAATIYDGTLYGTWNNSSPLAYTVPAAMKTIFERTVYIYEAKAVAQNQSSLATCVVVGGIYGTDTQPTYYRLDFLQADGKTYRDVLRNHNYRVNISEVQGRGHPTPNDAFNSQPFNMRFEIIEWHNGQMTDIIMRGQDYITLKNSRNENLDNRTAVVYRNATSTDVIQFETNIPLSEFVMSLNNGGDFPDPMDKTVIENDRFRVERKSVGGINYFEFTALEDYNDSATDNPSILTVTTNLIQFTIIIEQREGHPEGWIDGGEIDIDF